MITTEEIKAKSFGERLKQIRLQKGLSQSELAEAVGVHYSHIGKYERNQSRPYVETLTKLAEALSISADFLLEGVEEDAVVADFEDAELLKMFKEAEKLPAQKKEAMKTFLGAFLFQEKFRNELPTEK
jgi:transcriptional regulator with XRE-family HTH domain